MSEELVSEELADWEAEHEAGGHWAIRNRVIRGFWWTAFAGKDETTWDRFWAQFPKHLRDKCAAPCALRAPVIDQLTVTACLIFCGSS